MHELLAKNGKRKKKRGKEKGKITDHKRRREEGEGEGEEGAKEDKRRREICALCRSVSRRS